MVFAHIGGRYADIRMAHDQRIERAVEVHSAWGTFEWLVNDAFEQGYRVGIMANSDGHKGQAGSFPSRGDQVRRLRRADLHAGAGADAPRHHARRCGKRHHYGTTGCRMVLDTRVQLLNHRVGSMHEDPLLGRTDHERGAQSAMMGDIVGTTADRK